MTDYIKVWTCICDEEINSKNYIIDFLADKKYCQDCGKEMITKSFQEIGIIKENDKRGKKNDETICNN